MKVIATYDQPGRLRGLVVGMLLLGLALLLNGRVGFEWDRGDDE